MEMALRAFEPFCARKVGLVGQGFALHHADTRAAQDKKNREFTKRLIPSFLKNGRNSLVPLGQIRNSSMEK